MDGQENHEQDPENFEEEDPMAFLPADHHLLAPLQKALYKQLKDEHSRV